MLPLLTDISLKELRCHGNWSFDTNLGFFRNKMNLSEYSAPVVEFKPSRSQK